MTSNSIAGFPWNHRSESRAAVPSLPLPVARARVRALSGFPNINFNLHKCIIINSIGDPRGCARDVAESDITQDVRKILAASVRAIVLVGKINFFFFLL